MTRSSGFKVGMGIAIAALAGSQKAAAQAPTLSVDPSRLPRLGTIDARFQSYNVEMVEVTGGRFWKPYRASASAPSDRGADNSGNIPVGGNPDLYAYREPIDLSNRPTAHIGCRSGPGLYARQRHLGQHHLFCRKRRCARHAAQRLPRGAEPRTLESCHRLCPRGRRRDRDLDGDEPRCPGRSRPMAERSGASLLRLHQIRRWQNCRHRIHERADAGRNGRRTQRLRRGSLRAGLQSLCCVHEGQRTGCDGSGPRFGRRDRSAAIIPAFQLRIHLDARLACSIRIRHRRFFLSSLRRGLATMRSGSNHARGRAFGSVAGEHGPDARVLPIAQGRICAC